ncbi:MAG: reverse transcriptase-like protein [Desulfobacter sp.]|nr:MAG: reverse transcriptase-like protein [Desulfobacter sp.]
MTEPPPSRDKPEDIQWKRMSFKGNKVWAPFDGRGNPMAENGKVPIKYNLNQDYEYRIKLENLKPEDLAVPAGTRQKKKAQNPEQDLPPNCIRIYTDGASSGDPGPSGIGILMLYRDNRKEISEFIGTATNDLAELKAIHRGLIALKRRDLPVRIFTGSSHAADQLKKKGRPDTHRDLILAIRSLMTRFRDIGIIKVKDHAGIKGNEVADFLAACAIKNADIKKGQSPEE